MLDTRYLAKLMTCGRGIVSGKPVFAGTRISVRNLFDYLEGGHDLAEFFGDFPSVSEEQVRGVLELGKDSLSALLANG